MDKALTLAEQAAEWVAMLEESGTQKQAEFQAWLKQSSHHVEEFLLASALYRELDGIDPQHRQDLHALMAQEVRNVVSLGARFRGNVAGASPWRWRVAAIAAAVTAVAISAIWIAAQRVDTYVTSTGEQRVFELTDGSVIYLNARSRVDVRFSDQARDIQLADGEALFKVARDPARPFRVRTDGAVIQALSTQFNVYRRPSETTVAVIDGAVSVSYAGEPPTKVTAGEEARIPRVGHPTRVSAADSARVIAWRQRRLVFKEDRLANIAAEFNRYNRTPQIRVEGAALNDRRLTGVFDADAPESLIRFLEGAAEFSVDRNRDVVVIRTR